MATQPGDKLYLDLLTKLAEQMKAMYSVFADHLGSSDSFWALLSDEVDQHLRLLKLLSTEVREGRIRLGANRRSSQAVKGTLDTLVPKVATWGKWGVAHDIACNFAMMMEHSLITRGFFESSEDDPEAVRSLFRAISERNETRLYNILTYSRESREQGRLTKTTRFIGSALAM